MKLVSQALLKYVLKVPSEMQVNFPFSNSNMFSDSHRSPHFSCYRFLSLVVE